MTRLSAAVLITALGILPAAAQSAPPSTAPAPAAPAVSAPAVPAAAPQTPAMTKDGMPRMMDVRAQCRDEINGQALQGEARRDAMAACIVKARSDKAAQIKCAMDPQAKGLAKDARRAFVKDCVGKAKG